MKENTIRVVILAVNGIYSQIYDELYCSEERYNEILKEFGDSDRYKIVVI